MIATGSIRTKCGFGEAFHSYLGFVSAQRWERLAELRAGSISEAQVFD